MPEVEVKSGTKYPGLQFQPDSGNRGTLFQAARKFLRAQFGQPTGFVGRIAGKIMANSASNRERSEWTLSLLKIQPADKVLEIGFGPGLAIEMAARAAGFVAGVDHSPVMVEHASKRVKQAVAQGRVSLKQGSASELPKFDTVFDKIFSINSIHFWDDPVSCLKGLRRILKAGGTIAITLQPRSLHSEAGAELEIGKELAEKLEAAGFTGCRVEIRKTDLVSAACVLASNPGHPDAL